MRTLRLELALIVENFREHIMSRIQRISKRLGKNKEGKKKNVEKKMKREESQEFKLVKGPKPSSLHLFS